MKAIEFLHILFFISCYVKFKMYRNSYNTATGFMPSQTYQTQQSRYGTGSGFQRTPLYPIGPTLTQPQFKPIQRGLSPSPYLNREGIRPPSYDNRYLLKPQMGQTSFNFQERQKKLIDRNQREIQEQQKRRQQIRNSYERQIKGIVQKLNRNMQKKQKLHGEIQNLKNTQTQLNQKLSSLRPPPKNAYDFQTIDRKQQEMIILKNKLMNTMRQNQMQLNAKQQQQQKYWEEQITEKQKILFQLEQNLRQKRLQLHTQKQKSLQRPDLLSIQEEVRASNYNQFVEKYSDLERRLKSLNDQREQMNKQVKDTIQLKKPQLHNSNIRREELKRQMTNLQLRVAQLQRVSTEMNAANQNLLQQLQRKQSMISKYEKDIEQLKSNKQATEAQISQMMNTARDKNNSFLAKSLSSVHSQIQQEIRTEQAKGTKLKNVYQKLYELLCSAVRTNIQQTFNETVSH